MLFPIDAEAGLKWRIVYPWTNFSSVRLPTMGRVARMAPMGRLS